MWNGMRGTSPAALAYILLWFCLSTLLAVYNKWLFGDHGYHLIFPVLVTAVHAVVHFCFSSTVLLATGRISSPLSCCCRTFRKKPSDSDTTSARHTAVSTVEEDNHNCHDVPDHDSNSSERRKRWLRILVRVIPCGVATALDIGLSNSSLKTLTLSFYTMVKSTTPMWSLVFALALGMERPSVRLAVVMAMISVGMGLGVAHAHESAFQWVGFFEALTASILGGARMVLIQTLLQSPDLHLDNPFATNMHLAPVMFATLLPTSALLEPLASLPTTVFFNTPTATFHTLLLVIAGGTLAFAMVCTEYRAIQLTSALSLSVAGIVKEVMTIVAGVVLFGDVLTPLNALGLAVCLAGIALYHRHVYERSQRRGDASGDAGAVAVPFTAVVAGAAAIERLDDDVEAKWSTSGFGQHHEDGDRKGDESNDPQRESVELLFLADSADEDEGEEGQ